MPTIETTTPSRAIEGLRALVPEAFADGALDWDVLAARLHGLGGGCETYGLQWPGRAAAIAEAYAPVVGRLTPLHEQQVGAGDTGNLIVEGENLAALKLLREEFAGRVKLVYIDPPYNTGKADFIYADDFARLTREKDAFAKTTRTRKTHPIDAPKAGEAHAAWLSMMYPRLAVARELMADDALIFVSIDDHEVHHLRLLLDEVFGEANFEGHLHWRRRHNQPNDKTKLIGLVAEHILCFAKDSTALKAAGVGKLPLTGKFTNPDDDPRGPWASKPWKVGSDQSGSPYAIETPAGVRYTETWMGERATYERLLAEGRIIFPRGGRGLPRKKYYRSEREAEGQCANNWWPHDQFGHNQEGNVELAARFGGIKNVFSNPKPTTLIRQLMRLAKVGDGDIVLDFFAGSGSTGDAVLQERAAGLDARFVLVQLAQEITGQNKYRRAAEEALSLTGRPINIAELTKERLRRAAEVLGGSFEVRRVETGAS